jgi:RHS repeat-associated protein
VVEVGVTYDYDAFGNLLHSTGTTPNNYLFAGEQFDPDLGFYYNRARYFNASTGRFWSADTFEGDPASPLKLHRYLYAGVDPINRRDPTGLDFDLTSATVTTGIVTTLAGATIGGIYTRTLRGIALGAAGGGLVGLALANTDRRLAFRAISGGALGAANQLFVNYLLENRARVLNQPPPSPQKEAENVLAAFDAGVVGGYSAYVVTDVLRINPYLAAVATSGVNSGVNAILQGQSLCDFCAGWIASSVISARLQGIGVGDTIDAGGSFGFEADAIKSLIRTGFGRTFGTTFRQISKFLDDFGEPQAAKSFICD